MVLLNLMEDVKVVIWSRPYLAKLEPLDSKYEFQNFIMGGKLKNFVFFLGINSPCTWLNNILDFGFVSPHI